MSDPVIYKEHGMWYLKTERGVYDIDRVGDYFEALLEIIWVVRQKPRINRNGHIERVALEGLNGKPKEDSDEQA